jgi:hypothetical protein
MSQEPLCVVERSLRSTRPEVHYDVWAMPYGYRVAMVVTTLFEDRENPPFGSKKAQYLGRVPATSSASALKRYRQEEKAENELKVTL